MRIKFSILFLICGGFLNAQIAGYMGKRAIISYSNYFMLGLKGPGPINSEPRDESSFTINNVHCLNFEYAYKQRKMVCVSGQYLRTGVAYDRGIHDGFFDSESSSDYPYGGLRYAGDYSKPALVTSINFGLGVKFFKSGYLAPVGRYKKFEFLFLNEKIQYDYKNFKRPVDSDPSNDMLVSMGTGEYTYKNVEFVYTMGRQTILNDKIVLDYGVRFAWSPSLNIVTLTGGFGNSESTETYFRRETNIRVAREQILNFHLGIGFLAF